MYQAGQSSAVARSGDPRAHRAWWVAVVTGLVVLVTGWSTGMPDMLTDPLRGEFGWSRDEIGFAFASNTMLYGVTAPFAAALMDRFGIRNVVVGALTIMAGGCVLTLVMRESWQLTLGWGLLVGLGTGSMALTFAASVTNRWFVARRGLVSGVLTSASMFGGMGLMPLLAWLVHHIHWRAAVIAVGLTAVALIPLVWLVLRDHPGELGMKAYGAVEFTSPPVRRTGAVRRALGLLMEASKNPPFWFLVCTFGVCGASTNGIMMTHFVPAARENGMPVILAASLLAGMGVCNVAGAAGSGWLTDRFDARWLLAVYYSLRGVSLVLLSEIISSTVGMSMVVFVIVYGLLDLATVPPTIALCREFYGQENGSVLFGWVSAAHAAGAAAAAFLGGVMRDLAGSYTTVWISTGSTCAIGALAAFALRNSWSLPVATT